MAKAERILGVDPGTLIAGFACIASSGSFGPLRSMVQLLDIGVIRLSKNTDISERLGYLHESLFELIREIQPTICCIEKPFFGQNANTTIRLGESRGAIISAVRRHGVRVYEVTPASVKKMIGGSGQSTKEQVRKGVETLMGIHLGDSPFDASDALAIALYQSLQVSSGVLGTSITNESSRNL